MDTLPIHRFMFNSNEFNVYGSHEEPLFLVNDVICKLLGMKNICDNNFFRDKREDTRYIKSWDYTMSPIYLQERLKNTPNGIIYMFTEKGLYKCLMRSNKPIANLF